MRIDRLLWCLRLAPSRAVAREWVLAGHIRCNGRRVIKPAHGVRVGDVLTLPLRSNVRVLRLVALPVRRGPATEAQTCYALVAPDIESDSQGFAPS
jgi:ribosome-associated heat shock protein Hsp15